MCDVFLLNRSLKVVLVQCNECLQPVEAEVELDKAGAGGEVRQAGQPVAAESELGEAGRGSAEGGRHRGEPHPVQVDQLQAGAPRQVREHIGLPWRAKQSVQKSNVHSRVQKSYWLVSGRVVDVRHCAAASEGRVCKVKLRLILQFAFCTGQQRPGSGAQGLTAACAGWEAGRRRCGGSCGPDSRAAPAAAASSAR